jgi:hypothetical protein
MEFIDITNSAKRMQKSVSTIKRMIATVKKNNPEDYANKEFFKFEPLSTGNEKIYINTDYLVNYFNGSKSEPVNHSTNHSKNYSTSEPVTGSAPETLYKELFEVLKRELEVKNSQIEALQDRLKESNILALENTRSDKTILLDEPKKRTWWGGKK